MVYSFTPFFNEYEILEMRLAYLDSIVDKFVLAESDQTFNGTPKPWNFLENKERFSKWLPKIEYIQYKMPRTDKEIQETVPSLANNIPMARDNLQRGALYESETWQNMKDTDFGILSDLDEFPMPHIMAQVFPQMPADSLPIQLKSQMHVYYMNYVIPTPWWAITIFTGKDKHTNKTPQNAHNPAQYFRNFRVGGNNGNFAVLNYQGYQGYHFTYMGGKERILYKIREFAHQEWNHLPDEHFTGCMDQLIYYPTREPVTIISLTELPPMLADYARKFKFIGRQI